MLEVGDKPEVYYLVTSDEQIIDMWADGFNALIGQFYFAMKIATFEWKIFLRVDECNEKSLKNPEKI